LLFQAIELRVSAEPTAKNANDDWSFPRGPMRNINDLCLVPSDERYLGSKLHACVLDFFYREHQQAPEHFRHKRESRSLQAVCASLAVIEGAQLVHHTLQLEREKQPALDVCGICASEQLAMAFVNADVLKGREFTLPVMCFYSGRFFGSSGPKIAQLVFLAAKENKAKAPRAAAHLARITALAGPWLAYTHACMPEAAFMHLAHEVVGHFVEYLGDSLVLEDTLKATKRDVRRLPELVLPLSAFFIQGLRAGGGHRRAQGREARSEGARRLRPDQRQVGAREAAIRDDACPWAPFLPGGPATGCQLSARAKYI